MSFKGKVVIVTGGSSGIGASTAILFAKEGADVAIVARNEAKLKNIEEKVSKVGKKPLIIQADLSKEEETKTVVTKTIDKFGKLDVLVNNAGIMRYASVLDENLLQAYDEVMNTNLRSVVLLTNLAAPHLVKTKGNIVNVSSLAATSPCGNSDIGGGFASYCTSKAGLNHFSRVAAVELARKGVRVNIVSPGPVQTDILETNPETNLTWDKLSQATALKILTQPEEIAELIVYLASDKAKSITGADYLIDCGMGLLT